MGKGKVSKSNLGFLKLSWFMVSYGEKIFVYNCSYYILQYSNIMGKSNQNKPESSPSLPFKCISFRKVTSSSLLAAAASLRVCHSSFARAARMKLILCWRQPSINKVYRCLWKHPLYEVLVLGSWSVAPLPKKVDSFSLPM